MRLDPKIIQNVKNTQATVFRLADRDHGLSRKAISLEAGIDYDSVCNYAKGETLMSVATLYALVGVIPDELLSLLLPDGRQIVQVPEEIDHDAVCELAKDYLSTKVAAHRADSPAGVEIAPCEDSALRSKIVKLRAA